MFDNHLYNLITQLAQEHKSLWRIKNMYKKDAADCAECRAFWEKMEKEKEGQIEKLQKILKNHI
ncbi:MAG: hypothetical protein ABIJ28_00180 [Patescibacteria group bacterium]